MKKRFINNSFRILQKCENEVIIENSPFITSSRMEILYPILANLAVKGVKIYIITRNPLEHEGKYIFESEFEIQRFENSGIQVLLCEGNHHRKLSIIDRTILWEGSLNILSQINSREIMRRMSGENNALQMLKFLNYNRFLSVKS